jgi:hypothetical protein
MNSYVGQFLEVIRQCNVDNTYKMAWARALVEISCEKEKSERVELSDIAIKIFKYYWNQTIYFDLNQGSNISKPPEYITEVKKQIQIYYEENKTKQPKHFERIDSEEKPDIKNLVRILKQDVSWRFLNLNNKTVSLYQYQKGSDYLILPNQNVIEEYSDIMFESINFRWTQILENFNSSPRIAKKVRVLDLQEIKRNNLSRFRPFLNISNPSQMCFICGKQIEGETPSIDHVIPWSFLFNDDIWNLVYTHHSCNSQKSNIIPAETEIERLQERNIILYDLLKIDSEFSSKKLTKELEIAIEKDFVKKFWISCRT